MHMQFEEAGLIVGTPERLFDPVEEAAHRRMRRQQLSFEQEEMEDGKYTGSDQHEGWNNHLQF